MNQKSRPLAYFKLEEKSGYEMLLKYVFIVFLGGGGGGNNMTISIAPNTIKAVYQ